VPADGFRPSCLLRVSDAAGVEEKLIEFFTFILYIEKSFLYAIQKALETAGISR